jgi:hypothetical protein
MAVEYIQSNQHEKKKKNETEWEDQSVLLLNFSHFLIFRLPLLRLRRPD